MEFFDMLKKIFFAAVFSMTVLPVFAQGQQDAVRYYQEAISNMARQVRCFSAVSIISSTH